MTEPLAPDYQNRIAFRSQVMESMFEGEELPDFSAIPGQITQAEGNYLHWLLSKGYVGRSTVVEVGTWLGLSTVHLAQGLLDSGVTGKVHSYDRFIWAGAAHNSKSGLNLDKNANFRPYYEKNIEAYEDIVDTTTADFRSIKWDGEPIEILFLDAPKNASALSATLGAFAPSLIPGESIIVFQDYLHPPSYELALCVERLSDKVRVRHTVLDGGTVSFQVMERLEPQDYDTTSFEVKDMSLDEILKAWDNILSPMPEQARTRFTPGKAMHLYDIGEVDMACKIIEELDFLRRMVSIWSYWYKTSVLADRYRPLFEIFRRRYPPGGGAGQGD